MGGEGHEIQGEVGQGGFFLAAFICLAVVMVRCTSTSADGNPLTGFQLVDASNQTVLAGLTDNASIELDNPDNGEYGIQVNVSSSVGSVRMELSGAKSAGRTENIAPYSIYGDYEVDGTRKLNGQPCRLASMSLLQRRIREVG